MSPREKDVAGRVFEAGGWTPRGLVYGHQLRAANGDHDLDSKLRRTNRRQTILHTHIQTHSYVHIIRDTHHEMNA